MEDEVGRLGTWGCGRWGMENPRVSCLLRPPVPPQCGFCEGWQEEAVRKRPSVGRRE